MLKETLKNKNSILFLAIILITLPLKNIFVSISIILYTIVSFFYIKKSKFYFKKPLYIPMLFYCIMLLSLFWTRDIEATWFGLQKCLPFLIIPLAFIFFPKTLKGNMVEKIFRIFSVSMVFYALFYLIRATIGYFETKNIDLFFNNNLVPIDPGPIYMSVFESFALFCFIKNKNKKIVDKVGLSIIIIFIFLLSSKTIISIDFFIIICFYAFFAKIPKSTKLLTILSVSIFLFFSVFYVKKVKERFLIEYETAFVDNATRSTLNKKGNRNVSVEQAWNNTKFQKSDFFPSMALRVYQARIFFEIIKEERVFLTGFGLEASQKYIQQKTKKYNLYYEYGILNFHNQYIQTFAELGILGFIILILMLFENFKNAIKNKNFLHIAFSFTMIMLFLSESFFCRQRGIVFFVTLYCIFNSISYTKKNA